MRFQSIVYLALISLIACGDDAALDASTDVSLDAASDAAVDATSDAAEDAASDAAEDATDASTDASDAGASGLWARQPWEDCEGGGTRTEAGPEDYRTVLDTLMPGDTLALRPGMYTRGLPLSRSGEAGRCIVIEAANAAERPLFLGSNSFNVIGIAGASWIKIRHLDLDGIGLAGDGVKAERSLLTHHVVIEDLHMVGFGGNQQTVGISTKAPAVDWVIRGNTIEGAGTGLYLGNSGGDEPFIRGVIEFNTVLNPIGYAMQIKHQIAWPEIEGLPTDTSDPSETLIRWNVFSKVSGFSTGGSARPNLLIGYPPLEGLGTNDRVLIYGNFFYDNPSERLLQATGNVAIYDNVFVNPNGDAIAIQPHQGGDPRRIDVLWNTIVANGRGLRIAGGDVGDTQRSRYNAIFGPMPLAVDNSLGDVLGSLEDAEAMLVNPSGVPGAGLDAHPQAGALMQAIERGELSGADNEQFDFDERARGLAFVGAYSGPADGDAIPLDLEARPYE